MKKVSLLLALALLLTLTACRKKEPETPAPPAPPEPVEEDVLRLEELRAEFPRGGLDKDQLAGAVSLGYADESPSARPRKKWEEVVQFIE